MWEKDRFFFLSLSITRDTRTDIYFRTQSEEADLIYREAISVSREARARGAHMQKVTL